MTEENKLSLAEFVPARAELLKMAAEAGKVDLKDAERVHEVRIELRDARVNITKRGKELRDGALKFQKDVIQRERELVGIIQPEEERLQKADEEHKLRAEMEARKGELQSRVDALVSIGDELPVDEAEILAMDDNEFNAYRLRRIEARLLKDKELHEEMKRKEAEELRLRQLAEDNARREKLAAAERAMANAKVKAEAELVEAKAKAQAEIDKVNAALNTERARLAGIEEQRVREEAARKAEADRKAQEVANQVAEAAMAASTKQAAEEEQKRTERFQAWLKSIGFNEAKGDMLLTSKDGKEVVAYRPIGSYKV